MRRSWGYAAHFRADTCWAGRRSGKDQEMMQGPAGSGSSGAAAAAADPACEPFQAGLLGAAPARATRQLHMISAPRPAPFSFPDRQTWWPRSTR